MLGPPAGPSEPGAAPIARAPDGRFRVRLLPAIGPAQRSGPARRGRRTTAGARARASRGSGAHDDDVAAIALVQALDLGQGPAARAAHQTKPDELTTRRRVAVPERLASTAAADGHTRDTLGLRFTRGLLGESRDGDVRLVTIDGVVGVTLGSHSGGFVVAGP